MGNFSRREWKRAPVARKTLSLGEVLASLTPLRAKPGKGKAFSLWKSQAPQDLPLSYPVVFTCSRVEVPHHFSPHRAWRWKGCGAQHCPNYRYRSEDVTHERGQVLVGDPGTNKNCAGEHLGPPWPGTWPTFHLSQALPFLPTRGSGAAPSDRRRALSRGESWPLQGIQLTGPTTSTQS